MSPDRFTQACPHCRTRFTVPQAMTGQTRNCPKCASQLVLGPPEDLHFSATIPAPPPPLPKPPAAPPEPATVAAPPIVFEPAEAMPQHRPRSSDWRLLAVVAMVSFIGGAIISHYVRPPQRAVIESIETRPTVSDTAASDAPPVQTSQTGDAAKFFWRFDTLFKVDNPGSVIEWRVLKRERRFRSVAHDDGILVEYRLGDAGEFHAILRVDLQKESQSVLNEVLNALFLAIIYTDENDRVGEANLAKLLKWDNLDNPRPLLRLSKCWISLGVEDDQLRYDIVALP